MGLPIRTQLKYWGIAAAVFLALLWLMGNTLLPFIVAAAIAYLLDPIADRLERLGLSRLLAVIVITLMAVVALVALLILLVPVLIDQGTQLINTAPDIFRQLLEFLSARFPEYVNEDSVLRDTLANVGEMIRARGGELLNTLMSSVRNVVSALVFIVIVPVVSFYLLLDWDNLVARIDSLLPRDHAPTIRRLALEVDEALSGFVRGQSAVIGILAIYYSVTLMSVGLPFGLVVGVVTGGVSFIPYIGAILGGTISIGLALFTFWGEPVWIAAVVVIFIIGQILEGNILVPKLVGGYVGLHPVWLLLALSVFGSLFGFAGMLVAVPVAAALGVLVRFAAHRYRESALYRGDSPPVITPDGQVIAPMAHTGTTAPPPPPPPGD
ncbi:AI-2E family transporter [Halodurantibacterium flavum]|uniref:AI-2E family transporter n=1 Tax=Halodurantibacterium flavum TaxID=1382802 RepID=A0ABW4S2K4_9RHOB